MDHRRQNAIQQKFHFFTCLYFILLGNLVNVITITRPVLLNSLIDEHHAIIV